MKRLLFLIAFLPIILTAAEKEVNSKLNHVTVFFQGAQLERTASVTLKKGTYEIILSDLENNIDNNSIQVRGKGDYIIKSFFTRRNFLQEVDYSDEIRTLEKNAQELYLKVEELQIERDVLQDEQNLIINNQRIAGQDNGVDISQLKETALFYQNRLKEIKLGILNLNREINKKETERTKIYNQIKQLRSFKQTSVNQLVINVEVEKDTRANFEINYYVPNASWSPFYEVMVDEINKPINLIYKANVNQNTGVDWKNVSLTLSTTQPNLSGQLPALSPWYISFYNPTQYNRSTNRRNYAKAEYKSFVVGSGASGNLRGTVLDAGTGESVPFATIVAKDANGNTVSGATTDFDGNFSFNVNQNVYSLEVNMIGYGTQILAVNGNTFSIYLEMSGEVLSEVSISANDVSYQGNNYAAFEKTEENVYRPSTIAQKATFFEYHITSPYDVSSNNMSEVIHIRDVKVNANYQYQTVPKLDKDVFLIAQIYGWEEYNLLNGSARLYFEKTFVGESFLNIELTEDTLGLSLGRDKNIIVTRDKVYDKSGVKSFSGNKKETREFMIQVRNNKSSSINLMIKDQYPLAKDKKINIKLEENSDGSVDEKAGYITWKLDLAPTESTSKTFRYSVAFPTEYHVNIGE